MLMALYVSHHHICNTYDLTRMCVCFVRKKGNTAHYFYITITHSNRRRLTKNKLICLVMVLLTSELFFSWWTTLNVALSSVLISVYEIAASSIFHHQEKNSEEESIIPRNSLCGLVIMTVFRQTIHLIDRAWWRSGYWGSSGCLHT